MLVVIKSNNTNIYKEKLFSDPLFPSHSLEQHMSISFFHSFPYVPFAWNALSPDIFGVHSLIPCRF